MAIKDFLKRITKPRDAFDTKGLEKFSSTEQERILNRLGDRQAQISKQKAEEETQKRIALIERQAGIKRDTKGEGKSFRERVAGIKKFRERNLERRAMNLKKQADLNKKLGFGVPRNGSDKKLEVKPFKLNPRGLASEGSMKTIKTGVIGPMKSTGLKAPTVTLK